MAGTISDFRSSFTRDIAKSSRFDVNIATIPAAVLKNTGLTSSDITLRCDVSELPGRSFQIIEQKIYGPAEKYPVQNSYGDISFSFYCQDSMIEKSLFDNWLSLISPENDWNYKYKNSYVTDIIITQYTNSNEIAQQIKLIDAFPHTMNSLDLNWSNDSAQKVSVVFSYHYWQVQTQMDGTVGNYISTNTNSTPINVSQTDNTNPSTDYVSQFQSGLIF